MNLNKKYLSFFIFLLFLTLKTELFAENSISLGKASAIAMIPTSLAITTLEAQQASPRVLNSAHIVLEILRLTNILLNFTQKNDAPSTTEIQDTIFFSTSLITTIYSLAEYCEGFINNKFYTFNVEDLPAILQTKQSFLKIESLKTLLRFSEAISFLMIFSLSEKQNPTSDNFQIEKARLLFFKNISHHLNQVLECSPEQKTKKILNCLALVTESITTLLNTKNITNNNQNNNSFNTTLIPTPIPNPAIIQTPKLPEITNEYYFAYMARIRNNINNGNPPFFYSEEESNTPFLDPRLEEFNQIVINNYNAINAGAQHDILANTGYGIDRNGRIIWYYVPPHLR